MENISKMFIDDVRYSVLLYMKKSVEKLYYNIRVIIIILITTIYAVMKCLLKIR